MSNLCCFPNVQSIRASYEECSHVAATTNLVGGGGEQKKDTRFIFHGTYLPADLNIPCQDEEEYPNALKALVATAKNAGKAAIFMDRLFHSSGLLQNPP